MWMLPVVHPPTQSSLTVHPVPLGQRPTPAPVQVALQVPQASVLLSSQGSGPLTIPSPQIGPRKESWLKQSPAQGSQKSSPYRHSVSVMRLPSSHASIAASRTLSPHTGPVSASEVAQFASQALQLAVPYAQAVSV